MPATGVDPGRSPGQQRRPAPGSNRWSLPRQHLRKPGHEAKMSLKPRFMAIHYRGSAKLEGKVALITGGDSGIGRAVAVLFAREGADVAIVYLNEHEDALETQAYVEREGGRCVLIPGDVRHARFCERAVAKTVKALGGLDILVNNSAFQEHAESIEDVSEARFDLTLKTNVYGYFQMAKAAVPYLTEGSADHQHRVRYRPGRLRASCWITRPPRARYTRSPSRWRATFCRVAYASTPLRPVRYGRH